MEVGLRCRRMSGTTCNRAWMLARRRRLGPLICLALGWRRLVEIYLQLVGLQSVNNHRQLTLAVLKGRHAALKGHHVSFDGGVCPGELLNLGTDIGNVLLHGRRRLGSRTCHG
jgi:hypothetical protein